MIKISVDSFYKKDQVEAYLTSYNHGKNIDFTIQNLLSCLWHEQRVIWIKFVSAWDEGVWLWVSMCECVCACVCVCMCVFVCLCEYACVCVLVWGSVTVELHAALHGCPGDQMPLMPHLQRRPSPETQTHKHTHTHTHTLGRMA